MYNTQKMITTGRETMQRHPARDLTAFELHTIREQAGGDEYLFAENAFMFGVAVGMRIAEAERKRQGVKQCEKE